MGRSMRLGRVLVAVLVAMVGWGLAVSDVQTAGAQGSQAKNVILLIGDGMGFSEVALARLASVGPGGKLTMDRLPYLTAMTTHSLDALVTDSSAGGTAIASGVKTNNHLVGVNPDLTPLPSVLEDAARLGKSTGLVSTSRITDATPAVFAAHPKVPREAVGAAWENEVPGAYLERGVDVLLGGGIRHWIPKSWPGSRRPDEADYVGMATQKGYRVVKSRAELQGIGPASTSKLLGLFSPSYMAFEIDRDPAKEPSLAEMTGKALEVLAKNPKGFFLMVEGGLIDIAGHYWDAAALVKEVVAFDEAVKVAFEFSRKDGQTLVIVTADHATGGLRIAEPLNPKGLGNIKASAARMAKRLAPDRANVREVLADLAGITDLTEAEIQAIRSPQGSHVGGKVHRALESVLGKGAWEIAAVLSDRAGVSWYPVHVHARSEKTYGHEGTPVPVYAFGPGAEQVRGLLDNTDIARIMRHAFGLPPH
ncbi:MAG: alkaline phosphatase [Candidatus Rokubacteria bacterium]|nr:alkaline phosphatase [Candidatus Rokubacteria bacterium]